MSSNDHHWPTIDRRSFVKATLIPAAAPIAAALATHRAACAQQAAEPAASGPDIIDSNVHLFDWPFRKLKYARDRRARSPNSEAPNHAGLGRQLRGRAAKQLDAVNRRLAEECRTQGDGMLIPIGSVNPAWPDWDEDLRRCHEQYRMRGVRLYPAYHGYTLDHPEFTRLLGEAAKRGMLVQIVLRLEDERVHHPAIEFRLSMLRRLSTLLKKIPSGESAIDQLGGTAARQQRAGAGSRYAGDVRHRRHRRQRRRRAS